MKYLFALLFIASIATAQKVQYYRYGDDGWIITHKIKDSTFAYSQVKAKRTISWVVGDSVMSYYKKYKPKGKPKRIKIKVNDAEVEGLLTIKRKGTFVNIIFYYETVYWNTGIIEKSIK